MGMKGAQLFRLGTVRDLISLYSQAVTPGENTGCDLPAKPAS